MNKSKLEKTIEGIEAIREFFGFGLPSQNKVFEAYQTILTDTLELLKKQTEERCNMCKFYEGVHGYQGHAPCSQWVSGGVLWNEHCSRFEKAQNLA